MKSLALLVTFLLILGLLGGPLSMYLATKVVRARIAAEVESARKHQPSFKAAVATLAALSIVVNVMFLIGRVPGTLRILSFLALCAGLVAIKKLYFLKF